MEPHDDDGRTVALRVALLAASAMTVMAGATVSPSLPLLRDAFADTPSVDVLAPLVLTLPALAIALGGAPVGWLLDRRGRKPVLVGGLLLYAAAGSAGLVVPSLHALLAARFVHGLSIAAVMTAATTLIGDLFEGDARTRLLGAQGAVMALGGVVFVSTGGLLATYGWRTPFGVFAIAVPLAILCAVAVPEPSADARRPASTDAPLPRATVAGIYAVALFSMTMFFQIPVQLPFFIAERLDGGPVEAGAGLALSTIASAVVASRFGPIHRRLSHRAIAALQFASIGCGFAGIALARSWLALVPAIVLAGAGSGLIVPNLNVWATSIAPPALRGRVVGGVMTSFFVGQFVSPFPVEPFVDAHGRGGAYGAASVAAIVVAVGFAVATVRRRR